MVGLVVAGASYLVVGPGRKGRGRVMRRLGTGNEPDRGDDGGRAPSSPVPLVATVARSLGSFGRLVGQVTRRPPDPAREQPLGVALALGLLVAVVFGPLPGAVVGVAVFAGWRWWDRGRPRRREAEIRAVLPDVIDLFRLAVGAGLSVHEAIGVVAPRALEPVGAALGEVRRRVGLGVRLGDALVALDDLGDAARPLQSALTATARYGVPLGAALDRVAVDARMLRRRRAEEQARKLPVKLLFPLVLCVLPAFGLLAVVPLLAGSLPSLDLGS
jgi:tight adherence protein C